MVRNDKINQNFSAIRLADETQTENPVTIQKQKLRMLAERIDSHNSFIKGQFVQWKPGLKNRKFPENGEPAIVTAVLPMPIFDPAETSAASPYFAEPLTLVIGTYRDDDLLEFRVDGRRFEPVSE